MADYVVTFSDTFTVASNTITKNFTLSNTANLILDVTPNDIAVGSNYHILKKVPHPKKGTFNQYISSGLVSTNGKIRVNLEAGTYQVNIYPKSNRSGYVQTTLSDLVIPSSGTVSQTVALAQANLVFKVNLDPGAIGWIDACDSDCNKQFYGEIGTDGYARIRAEAGTYNVSISPQYPTKLKTGMRLSNLVVSGSAQEVEVNLQPANITGNVSPANKAAAARIGLLKMTNNSYWEEVGGATANSKGEYFFYAENGTYKVYASCGGKTKCMAKGGSASARADGCAIRGKTKGKIC